MENKKKILIKYIKEKNDPNIDPEQIEEYVEKTLQWEEDNMEWITPMRDELFKNPLRTTSFLMGTVCGILKAGEAPQCLMDIWETAVQAIVDWMIKPKLQ